MSWFSPSIPLGLSVLFLIVIFIPIVLIGLLVGKGVTAHSGPQAGKQAKAFVIIGYLFYLVYVTVGWRQGWYEEPGLPPRILLYTTLPLLGILMLGIFPWKPYRRVARGISTSDWVQLHGFRFIGSFFFILFLLGELPPQIGIVAGLGDILTAASSFWVAHLLRNNKPNAKGWAYAWNTFGLLDILATSALASILTKRAMETGAQGVEALAIFPFCFIPAFAPATIIFLHFTIYRRLRNS